MFKACNKCETEYPITEFHKDRTKEDGLRTTCKSCKKASDIEYALRNKDKIALQRRDRYLKRYAIERAQQAEYARNNRELLNQHSRTYKKNNKGKINADTRKRQAAKLKATPSWADLDQIQRIYKACAKITEQTGIEHHVDHIIPLKGKDVCGLHVENNLAIIPARMNLVKSNKYNSWDTK